MVTALTDAGKQKPLEHAGRRLTQPQSIAQTAADADPMPSLQLAGSDLNGQATPAAALEAPWAKGGSSSSNQGSDPCNNPCICRARSGEDLHLFVRPKARLSEGHHYDDQLNAPWHTDSASAALEAPWSAGSLEAPWSRSPESAAASGLAAPWHRGNADQLAAPWNQAALNSPWNSADAATAAGTGTGQTFIGTAGSSSAYSAAVLSVAPWTLAAGCAVLMFAKRDATRVSTR